MTLRDIFSSIGSFFSWLWNKLLDTDIFIMLGFFVMIISPPFLIYSLIKTKKIGGFFLVFSYFLYGAFL